VSDLPSVTQILREAGLISTAWLTEFGRDRGSAVHVACQLLDEGDLDESSVDENVAPYLAAYKRFLTEMRPEILAIEKPVTNGIYLYRGTLDRIYKFPTKTRSVLVDIKCGACEPWHSIQTAGYQLCEDQTLTRACLHLTPDGYKWREHGDRNDAKVFLAALTLANWRRSNGIASANGNAP